MQRGGPGAAPFLVGTNPAARNGLRKERAYQLHSDRRALLIAAWEMSASVSQRGVLFLPEFDEGKRRLPVTLGTS